MSGRIAQLMLALLIALGGVWVGPGVAQAVPAAGAPARLEVAGLEALEQEWEAAMGQRRELEAVMKDLDRSYQQVLGRIDELKRGGVEGLERRELERLLRQARKLGEQLEALERQIQQLDERLARLSAQIVEVLDVERARLERQLVRAEPRERAELVGQLNELGRERARYARPLPRVDRERVGSMLDDADGLEDPGDMLAMADELQDTEAEIRRKLDAVSAQLEALRKRQRLLRRARQFSREERFFEEGDRGRTYASRERAADQNNDAEQPPASSGDEVADEGASPPPNANGDASPPAAEGDDLGNEAPPESVGNNSDPSIGFGNNAASPEPPPQDDVDVDVDGAVGDPDPSRGGGGAEFEDAPGGGPSEAPQPVEGPGGGSTGGPGGGDDPFGSPQDAIIVDRQADPNVSTRSVEVDESQLDDRIDSLEGDRRELERQAEKLRGRADRLRTRAQQVE